jgi:hypothetical protein
MPLMWARDDDLVNFRHAQGEVESKSRAAARYFIGA